MKAGFIAGIVIVALILVVGIAYIANHSTSGNSINTEESANSQGSIDNAGTVSSENHVITITDSGFSPQNLEIKQGDTVTWKNEGSEPSWPASAMHPTHTVYPGSDIKKCGTSEQGKIFDACSGIKNGESWNFQFNEKGTWGYHDHVRAGKYGKIIVN